MPHALVIAPNNSIASSNLIETLEVAGFTVSIANTLLAARQLTGRLAPAVVFAELNVVDGKSTDLLHEKPWPADTDIVLLAATPAIEDALQAIRAGALDYLSYPLDTAHLKNLLNKVKAKKDATAANVAAKANKKTSSTKVAAKQHGCLVGSSPAMQKLYQLIDRVAPTTATVMIIGESGSGKELVAQTVHDQSLCAKGPYIAINCGAISKDLISSALFGHEKGSFTGASESSKGYFEQAIGGTIFLDEITETSADFQIRLLRVLETGIVIPVGGKRQIKVDVRVIAATNRDPIEAVKAGVLREDLYYRLNTFPLNVPSMRKRLDDVSLLAHHFLERFNQETGRNLTLDASAIGKLQTYSWPGNVRELKNIMQRAFILADTIITEEHVIFGKPLHKEEQMNENMLNLSLGTSLAQAQLSLAKATLEYYDYDYQQAADSLQISVKQLHQLVDEKSEKKSLAKMGKKSAALNVGIKLESKFKKDTAKAKRHQVDLIAH